MKASLKPRESARTRVKGHRHMYALAVQVRRQKTHMHSTRGEKFKTYRLKPTKLSQKKKNKPKKPCNQRHSSLKCLCVFVSSPTLFGQCLKTINRLSGWSDEFVCVTEAALMFLSAAAKVNMLLHNGSRRSFSSLSHFFLSSPRQPLVFYRRPAFLCFGITSPLSFLLFPVSPALGRS